MSSASGRGRKTLKFAMMHGHVAGLTITVEPAVTLLQPRGVPGAVEMQQVARGAMQVETLGGGVGGDQNAHLRRRIVERRLDVLSAGLVHAVGTAAAKQCEHPVFRVPLPQATGKIVECGLVLGEDDQALAGSKPALGAKQLFDQVDQSTEAGVGNGVPVGDRGTVEVETQSVEGGFDAANLFLHAVDVVPEPGPHDGCGGGMALLGFPIVAGLLPDSAFHRGQLRLSRRVRTVESLPCPVPGLGERGGTGEQPFAQDLHREGPGAPSPFRSL